ncbi:MAG: glycosyltransferase family 2 protein [Syntrophaceae bacterium]|nr:glycosyltransferase family 2 protein [Syntrophaceae bacterium]
MPPRISVIIPAFNAERFVTDALQSVLAQKYSSAAEIIVVDDGSWDNTRALVADLSARYPQITLILNERKKGPSGARNTGLLKATGDYIAFLDADDLWCPNHLELGVDFLESHNPIDIVFYNSEIQEFETKKRMGDWFSERHFTKTLKTEKLDDGYYLISSNLFNALLDESFMHLQTVIMRRSSIKGILFNENIKRSEDRDFFIRMYADAGAKFAYKNVVTGIYYRHAKSLTADSVQNSLATVLDHIHLFTGYLAYESLNPMTAKKLKGLLLEAHLFASYYYRQLNDPGPALASLFQSLGYGIGVSHLKEFAKIIASAVIFRALRGIRRPT